MAAMAAAMAGILIKPPEAPSRTARQALRASSQPMVRGIRDVHKVGAQITVSRELEMIGRKVKSGYQKNSGQIATTCEAAADNFATGDKFLF
jgi:hypothetical protein